MKKFTRITKEESIVFDAFRSGSAIVVFLGHIYQILIQPSYAARWAANLMPVMASYAVMVFFVLSGYMVTSSILRNISEQPFARFDVIHFAKDRLVRLYPPLILSLLLVVLIYTLACQAGLLGLDSFRLGGEHSVVRERFELDGVGLLGSLFFLQNLYDVIKTPSMNAPLWSLSHEFWFYFLAATFTMACFRVRGALVAFLLAITVLLFSDNSYTFFSGFSVWVSGAVLAVAHQNHFLQRKRLVGCVAVGVFVVGVVGILYLALTNIQWMLAVHKYIFGLLFCCSLACIVAFRWSGWARFGGISRLAGGARFSYTLYVIHWPLLMLVFSLCHSRTFGNPYLIALESAFSFVAIMYLSAWLAGYVENKPYILSRLSGIKSRFFSLPPAPNQ